ncbi:hypothetical protein D3C72_1519060 [compost metagenome]
MLPPWLSDQPNRLMAGMSGMPVWPPRPSTEPKAKYSDRPHAMVPSGRKWPDSFSVMAPSR